MNVKFLLKRNIFTIFVLVFFLLTIITDFVYKIGIIFQKDIFRVTLLLKAIMLLIMVVVIFVKITISKLWKMLLLIGSLIIFNAISDFSFNLNSESLIRCINIQLKYIFGLLVLVFFNEFYNQINSKIVLKFISLIVLFNFLLILTGYYFELDVFNTYYSRLGVNGVFKSTSTASYFYMFATLLLYFHWHKRIYYRLVFLMVVISALFVGSKTLYFFIIYLLLLIFYKRATENFKIKNRKLFKGVLIGSLCLIFIISTFVVIELNEDIRRVYLSEGYLTTFFSFRDRLALDAFNDVSFNWNIMHYLIGGLAGINRVTEIGILDVLLNYGLVGSLIYFLLFIMNIKKYFNVKLFIYILPIIGSIVLRGNFLYDASVIFVSIVIFVTINKSFKYNSDV